MYFKPQVTHGEFSFTLNYEINGEEKVLEDTIICDYDGIDIDEGRGIFRKWKAALGKGGSQIVLWKDEDDNGVKQEIYYNYAPPGYYMGDPEYSERNKYNASDVVLKKTYPDSTEELFVDEEELLDEYHIKIISWDCEQPIK